MPQKLLGMPESVVGSELMSAKPTEIVIFDLLEHLLPRDFRVLAPADIKKPPELIDEAFSCNEIEYSVRNTFHRMIILRSWSA